MLYYPNLSFIFLQHSETFDVSRVILPLSYQRSNRSGFLAHPVYTVKNKHTNTQHKILQLK